MARPKKKKEKAAKVKVASVVDAEFAEVSGEDEYDTLVKSFVKDLRLLTVRKDIEKLKEYESTIE